MAGLPELRVGVGVASGNVVLGHVGAQQRKDFTCIGDTVNMAARLETLSKGRVESFVANFDANSFAFCVEKSHFRTGGEVNIKGKTIRQAIYEMSFV
jgi:adenylate cyclase